MTARAAPAAAAAATTCLVVAAEADGVGPSVLVTCCGGSRRQYLFSCAEGYSRLALECRVGERVYSCMHPSRCAVALPMRACVRVASCVCACMRACVRVRV
jgi:hypothetical protein